MVENKEMEDVVRELVEEAKKKGLVEHPYEGVTFQVFRASKLYSVPLEADGIYFRTAPPLFKDGEFNHTVNWEDVLFFVKELYANDAAYAWGCVCCGEVFPEYVYLLEGLTLSLLQTLREHSRTKTIQGEIRVGTETYQVSAENLNELLLSMERSFTDPTLPPVFTGWLKNQGDPVELTVEWDSIRAVWHVTEGGKEYFLPGQRFAWMFNTQEAAEG